MRTSGTRRTWSSGEEWVAHLRDLLRRLGIRSKTYRDIEAHLAALEVAIIDLLDREELLAIRAAIEHPHIKPARGHRAGSHYERIVGAVNNALYRRTALIGRHREVA